MSLKLYSKRLIYYLIPILGGAFVAAIILALVYSPFQLFLLRKGLLFSGQDFYINFDKLESNFRDRAQIENVTVTQVLPEKLLHFEADSVTIKTKQPFFRGKLNFKDFVLYNPTLEIQALTTDKSGEAFSLEDLTLPAFSFENFEIRDGEIFFDGSNVKNIGIKSKIVSQNDSLKATIKSHCCDIKNRPEIKFLDGSLTFADELNFNFNVVLNHTRMGMKGAISQLSPVKFDVSLDSEDIILEEVDSLFNFNVFEGRGDLDLRVWGMDNGGVHGKLNFTGKLFGETFKGAESNFTYRDDTTFIRDFTGEVRHAFAEGNLTLATGKEPIEYWGELDFRGLDLQYFADDTGMASDFNGSGSLQGVGLEEENMNIEIKANLNKSKWIFFNVDSGWQHIRVTSESVTFYDSTYVYQSKNRVDITGNVEFEGAMDLNLVGNINNLDQTLRLFDIELTDFEGEGRLRGKLKGETASPTFSGVFDGKNIKYGPVKFPQLTGEFNINRLFTSPAGNIDFVGKGGIGDFVFFDSLYGTAKLKNKRLTFRPANFLGDSVSIKSTGDVYLGEDRPLVTLKGVKVFYKDEIIELNEDATIDFNENNIMSNNLKFSSSLGDFNTYFTHFNDGQLQLDGGFQQVDIDKVEKYLPYNTKISGSLSGNFSISLKDSLKNAYISYNIGSDEINYAGWTLGKLSLQGAFKDRKIYVDSLGLVRGKNKISVTGWYKNQEDGANYSFGLRGRLPQLEAFSSVIPQVTSIDGKLRFKNFQFSKLNGKISTHGQVDLYSKNLHLEPTGPPIRDLKMTLVWRDDRMTIRRLKGQIKAESMKQYSLWEKIKGVFGFGKVEDVGSFSVKGGVNFSKLTSPSYDLALTLDNLPIELPSQGIFLRADVDGLSIRGQEVPKVSGDVTLNEVNIVKLSMQGSSEEETTEKFPLEMNIKLHIPNNFWVLTKNIDAELQGDLRVTSRDGEINLLGELKTLRGNYFFYGNSFKIKKGIFNFGNLHTIDPKLEIEANTKISQKWIDLYVNGTLTSPELSFGKYSEAEVIKMIAGVRSGPEKMAAENLLQSRTRKFLEKYFETQMEQVAREAIGLETFEIKTDTEEAFDIDNITVSMGKYLTNKFYLEYTTSLSEQARDEINLEYRISKHMTLSAIRAPSDQTDNPYYRLDLNLKWDF